MRDSTMSSAGFSNLIELQPASGRASAAYGLLAALFAGAAVATAHLPGNAGPVLVLLAWAGIGACLAHRWRDPQRLRRAVLGPDGIWQLFLASGGPRQGQLVRAWGRSAGPFIGLQWRIASGRKISAWLIRPEVAGPTWRRLRVRLRMA